VVFGIVLQYIAFYCLRSINLLKIEEKKGRLHQGYYRNGENHRAGADVSFGDIVKLFGFRGVEIGRWVTREEQQLAANLFFDALADLMDILGVPEQVIALNGTLAINFGKGGRKGAFAHYNGSTRTLALAKNAGGGALAHEWFHAYDHYICTRQFETSNVKLYASEVWLNDVAPLQNHPLNQTLAQAFAAMFLAQNKSQASDVVKQSVLADKTHNMYYYARPQEVAARCFERMIQEHSIKNSFLVKGTIKSKEAQIGLYPHSAQLDNIKFYLNSYFTGLARGLIHQSQQQKPN
jgi:hypothetical protein